MKPGCLGERLLCQTQSVSTNTLNFGARAYAFGTQLIRPLVEQLIERGPRAIVGVGRATVVGERFETKLDLLARSESEANTRLVLAYCRGAFLKVQLAQNRHNRRDERFADDQLGAAAIVEQGYVQTFLCQERRERRACGAAADDADGLDGSFNSLGSGTYGSAIVADLEIDFTLTTIPAWRSRSSGRLGHNHLV
jgi:hypothetical protein